MRKSFYDKYGNLTSIIKPKATRNSPLFVDPAGLCRSPEEFPYSYDDFFLIKSEEYTPLDQALYSTTLHKLPKVTRVDLAALVANEAALLDITIVGDWLRRTTGNSNLRVSALAQGCDKITGAPYFIFFLTRNP